MEELPQKKKKNNLINLGQRRTQWPLAFPFYFISRIIVPGEPFPGKAILLGQPWWQEIRKRKLSLNMRRVRKLRRVFVSGQSAIRSFDISSDLITTFRILPLPYLEIHLFAQKCRKIQYKTSP